MFGIGKIISLLREINARIAHMALDTSKLTNIVGKLTGDIQTLISIARKGNTNPADQAAVDAIEQSLEALDAAVSQADNDLGPTGAPAPTGTTGTTGSTGDTGPAAPAA